MWRRFLPRTKAARVSQEASSGDEAVLAEALRLVYEQLEHFHTFDAAINELKRQPLSSPASLLASLILQTPRAVRAQAEMDRHKHDFHDRHARLFELIDFNDTFVAAVLALPATERRGFNNQLRATLQKFSSAERTPNFSDKQFDAIVHGLSREIAVFLAAKKHGYDVLMTSRADDAFGVDMQVRDPESGRYVNIDIKTHSSYFFRIKELLRERRIDANTSMICQDRGFCQITNHRNDIGVEVILFKIDHTELGDIVDFEFSDDVRLIEKLQNVIERCGLSDDGYGKTIAPLDY